MKNKETIKIYKGNGGNFTLHRKYILDKTGEKILNPKHKNYQKYLRKELFNYIKERDSKLKEEIIKPNYYKSKSRQDVVDVIDDFDMDFLMGNTFKYIVRASKKSKDAIEDLNKAKECIDRKIKLLENE